MQQRSGVSHATIQCVKCGPYNGLDVDPYLGLCH